MCAQVGFEGKISDFVIIRFRGYLCVGEIDILSDYL